MVRVPRVAAEPGRMTAVERWAGDLIAAAADAGPLPRYGDIAWQCLPNEDPRYLAAVLVAAESWRRHCDPAQISRELEDELSAHRWVQAEADAVEFAQIARHVRHLAVAPDFATLRERRAEIKPVQP